MALPSKERKDIEKEILQTKKEYYTPETEVQTPKGVGVVTQGNLNGGVMVRFEDTDGNMSYTLYKAEEICRIQKEEAVRAHDRTTRNTTAGD
jgi:hypothetical protein